MGHPVGHPVGHSVGHPVGNPVGVPVGVTDGVPDGKPPGKPLEEEPVGVAASALLACWGDDVSKAQDISEDVV